MYFHVSNLGASTIHNGKARQHTHKPLPGLPTHLGLGGHRSIGQALSGFFGGGGARVKEPFFFPFVE